MAAVAYPRLVQEEAKKVVENLRLPAGIKLDRMYFGTGNTGDSAVFVVFSVPSGKEMNPEAVDTMLRVSKQTKDALDSLETDLLPYVSFQDGV